MKFFFDNNLSRQMAEGMKSFGEQAEHLQDSFNEKAKDTEWLPYVGDNGLIARSRDMRIRKNPDEVAAYKRHKVKGFWFGGKNRSHCQLIQQMVRFWPRMKAVAAKESGPFLYILRPSGEAMERYNIDDLLK